MLAIFTGNESDACVIRLTVIGGMTVLSLMLPRAA